MINPKIIISIMFLLTSLKGLAQTAYVYRDSVYAQLVHYSSKSQALDSLQKVYIEEVQTERTKLQEKYKALATPYSIKDGETIEQLKARMSTQDQEKMYLLQEEDKLLETRIKSYNKLLEQQYIAQIEPYHKAVSTALEFYSQKNKLDYIFYMESLKGALAYVNKSKDVTTDIVKMVNNELQQ